MWKIAFGIFIISLHFENPWVRKKGFYESLSVCLSDSTDKFCFYSFFPTFWYDKKKSIWFFNCKKCFLFFYRKLLVSKIKKKFNFTKYINNFFHYQNQKYFICVRFYLLFYLYFPNFGNKILWFCTKTCRNWTKLFTWNS